MIRWSVVVFLALALVNVIIATVGETEFLGAVAGTTFSGHRTRPALRARRLPLTKLPGEFGRTTTFETAVFISLTAFSTVHARIIGTLLGTVRPEEPFFAYAIHTVPVGDTLCI